MGKNRGSPAVTYLFCCRNRTPANESTTANAETTKTVRETEAEAIAFIVCRAIGLETSQQHSDYIKLYRGDVEPLTASLEAIRETSARILGAIEERKTPERKERPGGSRKP